MAASKFTEDTRVKIPTILHLTRLGYTYLSLKDTEWDEDTNIFTALFKDSIGKINPDMPADDIGRLFDEVKLALDNEDLGQVFYDMLTARSGVKLIDFEDFTAIPARLVTH